MRLSMVMIAKNERENVRPCFASFWDHVDEVVLCDTGSRDGTVAEARRFARERGELGKLVLGRFRWCDDFAAARNHAHSLATGDVHCPMDFDDRLVDGGENLRGLAERLISRPELGAIVALQSGPMTPGSWRARLLRAPVQWRGPTWEEPLYDGPANVTTLARWEHTRERSRGRRDLDIALRWADADTSNPRPLLVAASEAANLPDWEIVEDCCNRGLSRRLDADSQAILCLLWAQALHARGKRSQAVSMAREAIRALPHVVTRETMEGAPAGDLDLNGTKGDAWLLLARCAADEEDHAEALRCATESVRYALTGDRMEEARRVAAPAVTMLVAQGRAPREAISTVLGAR